MITSSLAGTLAETLLDVPKLISAYYTDLPDPAIASQRVVFGTNGHRGSSFDRSFNEAHILAISQAICHYRELQGINGPLFLGLDTHALSVPAYQTTLEVLAANGVEVVLAAGDEYTPTPVISQAILTYNRGRTAGRADGIVLTPSHNPPQFGGFKYNPAEGGPADFAATGWIEMAANKFLEAHLDGVKRLPIAVALGASTTYRRDYLSAYVADLDKVLNMTLIRESKLTIGVDPLGGAGVHYWPRIAERYGLQLTVVNDAVDPTFRFVPIDGDGQIRMDPSSAYTMGPLVGMRIKFDIAFACDTDHDRHGIVTQSAGLMAPNHYLSAAIYYLCEHRPKWPKAAAIVQSLTGSKLDLIKYYHFAEGTVAGVHCIISRTGYTGEDGFELYHAKGDAVVLAEALLTVGMPQGLELVGLGARDSLRLEAGYPLYGHEITADISPLTAGLGWTVKLDKADFNGHAAFIAEKKNGAPQKVVFFKTGDRRIVRTETSVLDAYGATVGRVLSGTLSPILNEAIGSALVATEAAAMPLAVDIRGTLIQLQLVKPPFVELKKSP